MIPKPPQTVLVLRRVHDSFSSWQNTNIGNLMVLVSFLSECLTLPRSIQMQEIDILHREVLYLKSTLQQLHIHYAALCVQLPLIHWTLGMFTVMRQFIQLKEET